MQIQKSLWGREKDDFVCQYVFIIISVYLHFPVSLFVTTLVLRIDFVMYGPIHFITILMFTRST